METFSIFETTENTLWRVNPEEHLKFENPCPRQPTKVESRAIGHCESLAWKITNHRARSGQRSSVVPKQEPPNFIRAIVFYRDRVKSRVYRSPLISDIKGPPKRQPSEQYCGRQHFGTDSITAFLVPAARNTFYDHCFTPKIKILRRTHQNGRSTEPLSCFVQYKYWFQKSWCYFVSALCSIMLGTGYKPYEYSKRQSVDRKFYSLLRSKNIA